MPFNHEQEQPKHRSLRLTPQQHSRFTRRLAAVLFSTVIVGSLAWIAYIVTHPELRKERGPYQKAYELDALIHRDARFSDVRAWCWFPEIEIHDFGNLSGEARSDLERLVSRYAKRNNISVRYANGETEHGGKGDQK